MLIVTGDHSTPSKLKRTRGTRCRRCWWRTTCRTDGCEEYTERACLRGGLGQFEAKHLMLLAMAHAGRFGKYGA